MPQTYFTDYVHSVSPFGLIIFVVIAGLMLALAIARKKLPKFWINILFYCLIILSSFTLGWFGHEYADYYKQAHYTYVDCPEC